MKIFLHICIYLYIHTYTRARTYTPIIVTAIQPTKFRYTRLVATLTSNAGLIRSLDIPQSEKNSSVLQVFGRYQICASELCW